MKKGNKSLALGYKQSDVGIIPDGWSVDSFSSVTPKNERNGIVDGPFGSNLKTIHYRNSGIPIITSGYVTEGHFFADSYLYVDSEKFEQEKRSAVGPGDIVMAKIGARCGASAILPAWHQVSILSGNALKITVDESRHSTFYVWQVLWHLYFTGRIQHLRTVGAQPAISMAALKKYKLALPPLPEQRAIAAILRTWDTAISLTQSIIAEKQERKRALMQPLLTGKRRLPGFGGKWKSLKLGELFDERNENAQTGLPLLSITADRGVILQSDSTKKDTSNEDKTLYRRICPGDIGYNTMRMWQGRSALSTLEGIVSPAYTIVTPKKNADAKYFSYLFKSNPVIHLFFRNSQGLVDDTLNCKFHDFARVKVNVPPKDEQIAIAKVLMKSDDELALLDLKLAALKEQKKGLMQKLLTGEWRVGVGR